MKKITYIIIGMVVAVVAGIFIYQNGKIERECRKKAEEVEKMTARIDAGNAAEEAYYHCLIKKGADPYKYKWQGKEISESTRQFIESMSETIKKEEEKLEQAKERAIQKINENMSDKMVISKIEEKPDGWIFYYDSQKAVKTGNVEKYGIPGNVPLFIKKDGTMEYITDPFDPIFND